MYELNERHYSVQELAECWNVSPCTIRRLFAGEPGVLNLGRPSNRKRIYRPLRIPQSVAERVYRRITSVEQR